MKSKKFTDLKKRKLSNNKDSTIPIVVKIATTEQANYNILKTFSTFCLAAKANEILFLK